ncbi:MAG: tetratricopeptide repeat protein [Fuerstiella sp.]|nr:tetratricopeptide repeat protein [Fuerstiella sp.]
MAFIDDFHFLRPAWLLLTPLILWIWWLARTAEDPLRGWRAVSRPDIAGRFPTIRKQHTAGGDVMKAITCATVVFTAAVTWTGLWFTPDQQGQRLMKGGDFQAAAVIFRDPIRQGVAWFRAGEFEKAEQAFARMATPEAEFTRGNCLVMRGKYEAAIERFDRALELRPGWEDARINRSVAVARAKLIDRSGGDMGDQQIGADEIRFDGKKDSGGQDTEVDSSQAMSDSAMQALWLRRVQTKPADFLKAKFAYQLATGDQQGGEPVSLIITLYSPGPFSGTASFDLPELPRTAIIRAGSPVVGSETVDEDTWFTQRHELKLYTQRSGTIEIPSFRVQFSGKKTFTSAPEPMAGSTPKLQFQSNRPPGTDGMGLVTAATQITMTQSWSPAAVEVMQSGDVIQRTLTRQATGTTAMMMSPVPHQAPDGVRIYAGEPIVQDKTDRGQSSAERTETIKYQFERAGTYDLPDVVFVWWDTQSGQLKRESAAGRTISVAGSAAEVVVAEQKEPAWPFAMLIFPVAVVGWFCRKPVRRFLVESYARRHTPESRAARQVLLTCRADQPHAACAALLHWKRAVIADGKGVLLDRLLNDDGVELQQQSDSLSRHVFGDDATLPTWSGERLAAAFRQTCRALRQSQQARSSNSVLPALNPSRRPATATNLWN